MSKNGLTVVSLSLCKALVQQCVYQLYKLVAQRPFICCDADMGYQISKKKIYIIISRLSIKYLVCTKHCVQCFIYLLCYIYVYAYVFLLCYYEIGGISTILLIKNWVLNENLWDAQYHIADNSCVSVREV